MRNPRLPAAAALALALTVQTCAAFEFVATNAFVVPAGQTLRTELWCYAGGATIAGTAQDDLFLIADASAVGGTNNAGIWHRLLSAGATNAASEAALPTIAVSGAAERDLWALAPAIAIAGRVAGSARVAGLHSFELAGRIGHTLMAYGETVRLAPGSQVSGDVLILGQTLLLEGRVDGDTRLLGAAVTLAGEFAGTVRVTAPKLNVLPGTHIGGDLEYTSAEELVLPPGAQVGGEVRRLLAPVEAARTDSVWGGLVRTLGFFMAALLSGVVFVSLFPATTAMAHQHLEQSPWRCLLAGFVAIALLPMVILLLAMTIVGLPLAALLGCGYAIILYTGKILTALWLGRRLLLNAPAAWQGNALALLATGLLTLYALLALPFPIDIVLWLAFTCVGAGGLVLAIMDRRIPVLTVKTPVNGNQ